jgi:phosphoribosylformimino-5-aminoimidazole carboxamide ribotide isomerase
MLIIPVIDIRGGVAVRAVAGERARYRAIRSPVADSADPVAVARGYKNIFPFPTLYVADLDGIEGRGGNRDIHRRIADAWAGGDVWVDDGSIEPETAHQRVRPVIGSETLLAAGICQSLLGGSPLSRRGILSLDFRGLTFLGPPEVLSNPAAWPGAVIVMTLDSVGRNRGPDLKQVASIVEMAGPQRKVFAAGGVRDINDVLALRNAGASGVLVASALHTGKIKAGDLEKIAGLVS